MKTKTPTNITLTVDERDHIDAAKSRLRGCITLLTYSADHDEAVGVLIDVMRDSVSAIDTTFEHADERERRQPRGAR